MSFLNWEDQNWKLDSRCCPNSAEYRRGITACSCCPYCYLHRPGAFGLFGHLGTLLTHVQTAVHQCPQIPFFCSALQPFCPQPVALQGFFWSKCRIQNLIMLNLTLFNLGPGSSLFRSLCRDLLPSSQPTLPANLVLLIFHDAQHCHNGPHDTMRPPSVTMSLWFHGTHCYC